MAFGEKLKALREAHAMTQDDLAARLYVSRPAISKWETNRAYPSIDSLKAIQQTFGVSFDELIGDEDVQGSLAVRQSQSRRLFWWAIGCFGMAILFSALSVFVYSAGCLPWVLPLRVCAALGVVGYFILAMASKARYQPKPAVRRSWGRFWASRIVLVLIVAGVIVCFLIQG